jgi:hypothetical protein
MKKQPYENPYKYRKVFNYILGFNILDLLAVFISLKHT